MHVAVAVLLISVIGCACSPIGLEDVAHAQDEDPSSASVIIADMAEGFNLGNTFDLAIHSTDPRVIYPLIDLYHDAGMRHIRIPVTWMEGFGGNALAHASGVLNADHPRLGQLKQVIDYALSKDMYVVINAHHERSFKARYDGSPAYDTLFSTLWREIATYFRDYSQRLIFELLNEPEGSFGDWNPGSLSPFDPIALARTRQVYRIGYRAVRETGGRNATRIIMIGTNGMGNHSMIDEVYPDKVSLPGGGADTCLAIQVHTYDPWSFCGQDGSNAAYPGRAVVEQGLRSAILHGQILGVPLSYGEFGVGRASHVSERNTDRVREFYRTIVFVVRSSGNSSTAWDDRGWFGLTEPDGSGGYRFVFNIVPTMLAR